MGKINKIFVTKTSLSLPILIKGNYTSGLNIPPKRSLS
jgi:hypothetical protein